jgi:hypothetical protein
MRKLVTWGLTVTLTLGLGMAAARAADADEDAGDAKSAPRASGWRWNPALVKMFGGDTKVAPEKPAEKKTAAADSKQPKKSEASSRAARAADESVSEQAREKQILFRRLAVCDKLKQVANTTNDIGLLHRAEELEERAWTTFNQKTASGRPNDGKFSSDERVLDQHLGLVQNKKAPQDAQAYSVNSRDRNGRSSPKEEVDQ